MQLADLFFDVLNSVGLLDKTVKLNVSAVKSLIERLQRQRNYWNIKRRIVNFS